MSKKQEKALQDQEAVLDFQAHKAKVNNTIDEYNCNHTIRHNKVKNSDSKLMFKVIIRAVLVIMVIALAVLVCKGDISSSTFNGIINTVKELI